MPTSKTTIDVSQIHHAFYAATGGTHGYVPAPWTVHPGTSQRVTAGTAGPADQATRWARLPAGPDRRCQMSHPGPAVTRSGNGLALAFLLQVCPLGGQGDSRTATVRAGYHTPWIGVTRLPRDRGHSGPGWSRSPSCLHLASACRTPVSYVLNAKVRPMSSGSASPRSVRNEESQ